MPPADFLPAMNLIKALSPTNVGTGEPILRYADFKQILRREHERIAPFLSELMKHDPLYILPSLQLVETAYQMTLTKDSFERTHLAERYNMLSAKIFGQVDEVIATSLLNDYMDWIDSHSTTTDSAHINYLKKHYIRMKGGGLSREQLDKDNQTLAVIGKEIRDRYKEVIELPKRVRNGDELLLTVERSLKTLTDSGFPAAKHWSIEVKPSFSTMAVDRINKVVSVGTDRRFDYQHQVEGLLAHEILVHVLRTINGSQISEELGHGLPNTEEFEEGLGVVVEAAVAGFIPDRITERYLDIAWALGSIDGVPSSRPDMFKLIYARNKLRFPRVEEAEIIKRTWYVCDRIYRGTPGDNIGEKFGVFSRDLGYYKGYRRVLDYFEKELDSGAHISKIIDKVWIGKYDPTNPAHLDYVSRTDSVKRAK